MYGQDQSTRERYEPERHIWEVSATQRVSANTNYWYSKRAMVLGGGIQGKESEDQASDLPNEYEHSHVCVLNCFQNPRKNKPQTHIKLNDIAMHRKKKLEGQK